MDDKKKRTVASAGCVQEEQQEAGNRKSNKKLEIVQELEKENFPLVSLKFLKIIIKNK